MAQDERPVWKKLPEIPKLPGIYEMLDSKGNIIYIGKSKCLEKRVHSYFAESPRWEKAKKMAPLIYDINYIVTDTHLEAMLLECEMIKSKKPYFNAIMKNDEKYVYLTISGQKKGKLLAVTHDREHVSFGPFRSRSRLQEFIDSMENLYPLTEKRKKLQFEYHVFPQKLTEAERAESLQMLKKLLSVPEMMQGFMDSLEKRMKKAACEQKFETALKYRNILECTGYVRKNLREYGEWMNRQMIYMEDTCKGKKYFFIDHGLIIHKAIREENIFIKDMQGVHENDFSFKDSIEQVWLEQFIEMSRIILAEQEMQDRIWMKEEKERGEEQEKVQGNPSVVSKSVFTEKQKVDYQDIVLTECARAYEHEVDGRLIKISECNFPAAE